MRKVCENGIEYYAIDRLDDIQNQMLKLLKIIDSICRENNFHYWLDGGTAIGAYRHGGFVPWDDDLDINVLKPDYLKLMEILKNMDPSKYFLFDYNMDYFPCAFFGEKVNFFCCADDKKHHIYPIKIDIIPVNIIENKEEIIRENRLLRELSNLIFLGICDDEYRTKAEELYKTRFQWDRKKFMTFYNFEYGLYKGCENAVLTRPSMSFSTPKVYKYDEMLPLKEINFAGMQSFVPVSDEWLRDTYGEYMEYPKLDDRKPESRRVYDASNVEMLYKYLIDKKQKNIINKLAFALCATLSCK